MSYSISEERDTPRITPAVQWLIGLNVLIFFLQLTVVSPADMQGALGFEVRDLPGGWWKALTYMFVHGGFLHLAGNMYMLWLFGPRIDHQWRPGALPRPRERESDIDEIVAKSKAMATKRPAPLPAAPKASAPRRTDELNLVLDKISQHGLESLTSDERRLLEEMSRRLRDD